MAVTEAQKRAKRKYQSKLKILTVTLYGTDADIASHIDNVVEERGGYAEYIRELIRADMERG